jgi:chitinase
MAYDFSGPWIDTYGHHAQLYSPARPHSDAACLSGDSAVTYLRTKGVPLSKVILGIPAFGRSFLGVDKTTGKYTGHGGEEGIFEYKDLPRPGAQEYVDREVGAAYCTGGDGGFVSYDNPATVAMKAAYATRNGLGGLFFWTGTADAPSPRSLVETAFRTLHNC